jgi:hypothetical protein
MKSIELFQIIRIGVSPEKIPHQIRYGYTPVKFEGDDSKGMLFFTPHNKTNIVEYDHVNGMVSAYTYGYVIANQSAN